MSLECNRNPPRGPGGDPPAPVPSAFLIAGAREAQATQADTKGFSAEDAMDELGVHAIGFGDWVVIRWVVIRPPQCHPHH